jgi:hypothetical protein
MRPALQPGQLSVGVSLNVKHTAATPVGVRVRAVATYERNDGKLFIFKVEAFDDAGLAGEGGETVFLSRRHRLPPLLDLLPQTRIGQHSSPRSLVVFRMFELRRARDGAGDSGMRNDVLEQQLRP